MNYEQKYKQALERARIGLHDCNLLDCDDMTRKVAITTIYHLFPELTESDDERIRKGIIRNLQYLMDRSEGFVKEDLQERITWLQKQCVQKNTRKREIDDAYLQGICDAKHAIEKQGEQPIDKVELKFKVGEWITNGDYTWKIVEVKPLDYMLQSQDGNIVDDTISYVDEHFYLWSINDAKDGDVLMTTKIRFCPFIYRKTDDNKNLAYYYAGVDGNGDFREGCLKMTMYHFGPVADITPATKEQRDLLFKKMKEAGYEWYSEKKELKKIEPKTLNADKVIAWLVANICDFDYYVKRFKQDFGL